MLSTMSLLVIFAGFTLVSAQEPAIFSHADRALANNPSESNFRIQFSTSAGSEFVNHDQASAAADGNIQQTELMVDATRSSPTILFDKDSVSSNTEVVQKNAELRRSCVYDLANSAPCNTAFKEPTGRCTNTQTGRKTWGMAGSPYSRILRPNYEDGIGKRRVTEFTSGLPFRSPREISTTVADSVRVLNFDGVSSHVMQWGQFIAHEFTQLAETEPGAACCPDQIFSATNGRPGTRAELEVIRQQLETFRGHFCMQIELMDDPIYGEDVCIDHTRSRATPQHNCVLGPRQQMNAVTHVFDASNVYGSSQDEMDKLRASTGGRMKTQTVNGAILPPQDTSGCPFATQQANRCPFAGGDNRINTTPNLITAHTTFVVKHNQIADRLASINPQWDHERLFQESRRIMSAIQSNIHFYEWLPIIVGNSIISKYGLGSYNGFDSNVNPAILNECAGAAARFGHTLIRGQFTFERDNGNSIFGDLRQSFFDSDVIYNGGTRQCVRGLSTDPPRKFDENFPTAMRDFLFDMRSDILSLNINRGRDHGFNSYVDYRKHYGLSFPRSFNDLSATHPADVIAQLRRVYTTVNDVELYIGAVTEFPVRGGVIGELFANILGDQFSRSRAGDRLFFESSQSGLTRGQINAVRQYSYAQLLCEANGMEHIINKVFFRSGSNGARLVACSSFTDLDLDLWKDGSNTDPEPGQCHWVTQSTSSCCHGERTIKRRCVGQSSRCRCSGSKKISENCSPNDSRRNCSRGNGNRPNAPRPRDRRPRNRRPSPPPRYRQRPRGRNPPGRGRRGRQ